MLDAKLNERIHRVLSFQQPDRVPVCDFIDNDKIFHYFSSTASLTLQDRVKAYHGLGIDICWRFERRRDLRLEGVWSRMQKFALRRQRYAAVTKEELDDEFNDYKRQQKMFEPHTYLAMAVDGCLSIVYHNLGFEEFTKKMYTELIEIDRLIDVYAENIYVRAQEFARRESGEVFFIKDDIGFEKGLIFSLGFLQQHWLPRLEKAIEPLKEKNIKVVLHSAGNISEIIPSLISAGIDGIHPIDREAGMDAAALKKNFNNDLLLFGNISLVNRDNENIRDQIQNHIKNTSVNGGYCMGSCSGITKDVPFQAALSFFSAIKEVESL